MQALGDQRILLATMRLPPPSSSEHVTTARSIIVWMVLTIAGVGCIAYWDDQRESAAALADFAHEQVALARTAAASLELADSLGESDLPLTALRRIEEPESVIVLVGSNENLVSTQGVLVHSEAIQSALANGQESTYLSRTDASALGLPARTATAGIARAMTRSGPRSVIVVASALRERDRERRAQWRLALSFAVSSAIVLAFGALALRKQRKELELVRELAVADAIRVRDERLRRADKLATLGAIATGIAHEVSTPLGVIVGRAEQLAPKVQSDERARRAVAAIAEQADRIGKIIRGFLSLARGGAAALEHTSPSLIVRDAIDLVRHRFDQAHVELRHHVSDDLPTIVCDPEIFTQVLVNLLLNACDACEQDGHVNLSVAMGADHTRVCFLVVDDGTGISAEDAARATEPFFTTKAPGKGTGLGLAIANEIVLHHHGTLSLTARTDTHGTEARVEIPASEETP